MRRQRSRSIRKIPVQIPIRHSPPNRRVHGYEEIRPGVFKFFGGEAVESPKLIEGEIYVAVDIEDLDMVIFHKHGSRERIEAWVAKMNASLSQAFLKKSVACFPANMEDVNRMIQNSNWATIWYRDQIQTIDVVATEVASVPSA